MLFLAINFTNDVISESGEYKYRGIELTPIVFAELMVLLFDGKLFSRQDAIDGVVSYHTRHGGLAAKNSYVTAFKHGTNRFLSEYVVNVARGMWRLNYKSDLVEPVSISEADVVNSFENVDVLFNVPVDKQIGEGNGSVYVYYYDVYKLLAKANNSDTWACKVGMSSGDALSRVASQVGTAYPEVPHIGLVIKSDAARELELILHSVLKLRGRHMQDAPGKEWFLTSPDEVERIYNALI